MVCTNLANKADCGYNSLKRCGAGRKLEGWISLWPMACVPRSLLYFRFRGASDRHIRTRVSCCSLSLRGKVLFSLCLFYDLISTACSALGRFHALLQVQLRVVFHFPITVRCGSLGRLLGQQTRSSPKVSICTVVCSAS